MIELLADTPANVVGFEAVGEVSAEDYKSTLIPAVESAFAETGKLRLLYVLGERFDGISGGAAWQDFKLGMEHLRSWERIAVVTDVEWIGHAIKAFGWTIPATVRVFGVGERAAAEAWVAAD